MYFNKVFLIGRSGRDNGKEAKTNWFRVVAFKSQAVFVQNYLGKGRLILVEGHLDTNEWEQDGKKTKTVQILASSIQSLERGNESTTDD